MTWTNITIPDRHSHQVQQGEKMRLLEFEIRDKEKTIDFLYKELENIFESLKENKEVKITYGKETITARLIEGSNDQPR